MPITTQRRPAEPNKKKGNGSGKRAEILFDEECINRGIHSFEATNDVGIDRIVYHIDNKGNRVYKNVQVTIGSINASGNCFQVNKPISRLREDIDLVAICLPVTDEERNINSGRMGKHNMWLLIPAEVYCDDRMFAYYMTDKNGWYIEYKEHLKPPLDKALEAWWLFSRNKISNKLVESFF